MNLTITPTLYSKKKRKDGSIPIYIRITKDRKSNYISTGFYVTADQWNNATHQVRKSHRQYSLYNKRIAQQVHELEATYIENNLGDKDTDPKKLKEVIKPTHTSGIIHYMIEYRQHLKESRRYQEHKKFVTIITDLTNYLKNKDLSPRKFDENKASEFQEFLLSEKGNNPKTTNRKISSLRGYLKWLIKQQLIDNDPYKDIKVVTPSKTNVVRLTYEQIESIKNLDLKINDKLWHIRNYFLFSFYNAGIRFGDLCALKWSNIKDGRLVYEMGKTKHQKSIRQKKSQLEILNHYKPSQANPDAYIFPILRKKHTDPFELRREISSRNVIVNKGLKEIAEKASIESNVSFHIARHSFSQYALSKKMNVYSISKALGHSKIKVTEQYIKEFDEYILDQSMDELFD